MLNKKPSKFRKIISVLLTFWIPIKSYRRAFRGIIQLGINKYFKILKQNAKTKFKNELAIGAIMKNEGPYLKEWLDFHILIGIKKFYLYDNESTDNTTKILKPYIAQGIVEYHFIPGKGMQYPAYTEIVQQHANDCRWIAFIDLDEFIFPVHHKNIINYLHTLPKNFALLVVSWVLYGSSNHEKKQKGLIIENYKYHRKNPSGVKSIVNPRLIVDVRVHIHHVAGFIIDGNGKKLGKIDQDNNPPPTDKIRINHYVTKSKQEFEQRIKRGGGVHGPDSNYIKKKQQKFIWYNSDNVYDNIMDKYIKQLKKDS